MHRCEASGKPTLWGICGEHDVTDGHVWACQVAAAHLSGVHLDVNAPVGLLRLAFGLLTQQSLPLFALVCFSGQLPAQPPVSITISCRAGGTSTQPAPLCSCMEYGMQQYK